MLRDRLLTGIKARNAQLSFDPKDRRKHLNASEAGTCIRAQWYKRRDKHPFAGNGMTLRGHVVEDAIVECLRAANLPLRHAGKEQQRIVDDELGVAATPDGFIDANECGTAWNVVEIKSIDPRTNKANLPRVAHVTQARIQALLAQRCYSVTIQGISILYVNASDFEDITVCEVDLGDQDALAEWLKRRWSQVKNTRDDARLPREGRETGECRYCPYTEQCGVAAADAAQKGGRKSTRTRSGSTAEETLLAFWDTKQSADALKEELDGLNEALKEELATRQGGTLVHAGLQATLSPTKGRETLDKKAMAAAGIDLSPYTKVGAPGSRLNVVKL